jgi:hypothetical protein
MKPEPQRFLAHSLGKRRGGLGCPHTAIGS